MQFWQRKRKSLAVHRTTSGAIGLALLGTAIPAGAETISWVVGASAGYSEYRFKPKIDTSLSFPTVGVTLSASVGKFFATAGYAGSVADADLSEEDFLGESDRRDIDLTVGYQLTDRIGILAGWRDGRTRLHLEPREVDDDEAPAAGRETYQQDGYFIGANHTWRSESYGNLALSVAYARLDADNRFIADGDGADEGELPEFDDLTGRVSGDTSGFSYGLAWTKPLAGQWLYRAQVKINDYQQDVSVQGLRFDDLDQRFVSMTMGVFHVF